jgi:tetratricopeptide (TPR) repeat protein
MFIIRKFITLVSVGVIAAAIIGAGALLTRSDRSNQKVQPAKAESDGPPTPADLRIQKAQAIIKQSGQKPDGYNLLASAYMQKARETGDHIFNAKAEGILARSFEIDRDNYDALKLQAKLLLSNHRFSEVLEVVRRAQVVRLDDADVYGALTDANVELGNYDEAIIAAQKMVDLRPDTSAYSRIAYLRSLHGDTQGAIRAMQVAVKAAHPGDPESVAWCRVQLGNELLNAGKRDEAELEYDKALLIFPGHRAATEAKARARIAGADFNGAIEIYNRGQSTSPSADAVLALGDLYTYLGRNDEANKQYELFESLERENVEIENSWRHLIYYWLDHNKNLDEALTRARQEREHRRDIFTCDMLAWALFKNDQVVEARGSIDEALRLGTREARINYHAGIIYSALGLKERGARYLELARTSDPAFAINVAVNRLPAE